MDGVTDADSKVESKVESTNVPEARSHMSHAEVVAAFMNRSWEHQQRPRAPHSHTIGVSKDFRVLQYNGEPPLAFWAGDGDYMVVNGDNVSWGQKIRREMQQILLTSQSQQLSSRPNKKSLVIIPFSTLRNVFESPESAYSVQYRGFGNARAMWCRLAQDFKVLDTTPEAWQTKCQVVTVPKAKMKAFVRPARHEDGFHKPPVRGAPPRGRPPAWGQWTCAHWCQKRGDKLIFKPMYHDDLSKFIFGGRRVEQSTHLSLDKVALFEDMNQRADTVREMKVILDTRTRKLTVAYQRHSLGSCLFSVGGKHYLSARSGPGEMRGGADGYFLVELARRSRTIQDALDSLRPRSVKGAYKRQGEFFFVPTRFKDDGDIVRAVRPVLNIKSMVPINGVPAKEFLFEHFVCEHYRVERFEDYKLDASQYVFKVVDKRKGRKVYITMDRLDTCDPHVVEVVHPFVVCHDTTYICDGEPKYGAKRVPQNYILRRADIASAMSPGRDGNKHLAEAMIITRGKKPRIFVKGKVSHSQHRTVALSGWHEVFINTAKRSWSINGRVD